MSDFFGLVSGVCVGGVGQSPPPRRCELDGRPWRDYREVILDHYKNPRGHGTMDAPDAQAEGMNPLCGDEVTISVALADDGETIDEVKFEGRGCAISQAATSMLTEMVKGGPLRTWPGCPRRSCSRRSGFR